MIRYILYFVMFFFGTSVYAQVPPEVLNALNQARSDAIVVAGLALVIIVAIAAFKYMRRAL